MLLVEVTNGMTITFLMPNGSFLMAISRMIAIIKTTVATICGRVALDINRMIKN